MKSIEILAPSGDVSSMFAALEAGADAVYFGVSDYNARKRAKNIELSDLPGIVSECALRGAKPYLTLNILVSSGEISPLLDVVDTALTAGIKAFIVQDYGILYILNKFYPEAEIHISTQATTHLEGQIDFLSKSSVSRINLARELSISDICEFTAFAHKKGIETEVFVHGSYCLSYSGQCYLSSYLEGQSGNRGLCAQLCRRLYRKSDKKGYFLNLKDNSALVHAGKLEECGVDSLKIEGRIKGKEYVYSTVKTWKNITGGRKNTLSEKDHQKNLSSVFNRGFTSGYMENNITSKMFSANPSDSSFILLSEILSYSADRRILETNTPVEPDSSDSLFPLNIMIKRVERLPGVSRFICSGKIIKEEGYCKYHFEIAGKLNGKILKGDSVYIKELPLIASDTEKTLDNPCFRKIPLDLVISCREGEFFTLTLNHGERSVTVYSDEKLVKGKKRTATEEEVCKQISRFGTSALQPVNIIFSSFDENLFIPSSVINRVRRKAVSEFFETIYEGRKEKVLESFKTVSGEGSNGEKCRQKSGSYESTFSDLKTAVIVDNPDLASFIEKRSSCEIFYEFKDNTSFPGNMFIPVFPAVMDRRYAEECIDFIKNGDFNKVLINNTAMIDAASGSGKEWIAGRSLNITNFAAVEFFSQFKGFKGAEISPEAGKAEAVQLMEKTSSNIYFPLYSRAKLMTTRQCLLGYRCGKQVSDENCWSRCCGTEKITDVKGKKLLVEKRKDSFTELYDSRYHYPFDAVSDLKKSGITFVLDLRIFPDILSVNNKSIEKEIEEKRALFDVLSNFIKNPDQKSREIDNLIKITSIGNYRNGLL